MKVTIDTQSDTFDDIKKLLHILTEIIQRKGGGAVNLNQSGNPDTTNLMSMFSDENQKEAPNTPPDFSSFLNLTKKREDSDSNHKIEFY